MRLKNKAVIFFFLVFTILISEFILDTTIFKFCTAFSDHLTNEDAAQRYLNEGNILNIPDIPEKNGLRLSDVSNIPSTL